MHGLKKILLAYFSHNIMPKNNKKKNKILTPAEQKTTVAFKLMSEKIETLEKSLKITQDELESYRSKYYESDKNHAIEKSRNNTLVFHEILKFVVSVIGGGIGVNLISGGQINNGVICLTITIVIYSAIVFSDKRK